MEESQLTELTAGIVAAFVSSHRVTPQELPELITGVGSALWKAANPDPVVEPEVQQRRRSYTRRKGGQEVGQSDQSDQTCEIVDEREAEEALIEDVATDNIDEQPTADAQEDDGEPKAWVEPEPMFQD